eukprot:COSAG01_NODE_9603_length_2394_cov_1.398257_1_plen_150_part_10
MGKANKLLIHLPCWEVPREGTTLPMPPNLPAQGSASSPQGPGQRNSAAATALDDAGAATVGVSRPAAQQMQVVKATGAILSIEQVFDRGLCKDDCWPLSTAAAAARKELGAAVRNAKTEVRVRGRSSSRLDFPYVNRHALFILKVCPSSY